MRAPHPPSYDVLPTNPPSWLSIHAPLNWREQQRINHVYDLRVEDVQAIDDMIGRIRSALRASGQLRNTYIVFSSDNGLHMGEYRLTPGKLTAFDTDIHVPLVIDGPGIPAGAVTNAMSENTDLAPTFEQIAGTHAPCDGHTLMPLLHGGTPTGWRTAVLVEHHQPNSRQAGSNPDSQRPQQGNPPSYTAMRTPGFAYVAYRKGGHEFYDVRNDPFELHNVYNSLPRAQKHRLHRELARMKHCHGHRACWAAGHVSSVP
jgi:arylsulfatase A-like enzyme